MILAVTIRFGLLTTIVMFSIWILFEALPVTSDPGMRYFWTSTWVLVLVLAIAVFAAHASRAGRPLFNVSKSD